MRTLGAVLFSTIMMLATTATAVHANHQNDGPSPEFGGFIYHYSPDDGYDPSIGIRCNYGDPSSERWLAEGVASDRYCSDADQVHVRSGGEIWCKKWLTTQEGGPGYFWRKMFDATGWHKINDIWSDGQGCTYRTD